MLAQSFKPANELSISKDQHEALIKTLVLLETGKLTHFASQVYPSNFANHGFTGHFNMSVWNYATECGTVCCIGGTAELIGNVSFGNCLNIEPRELRNLFLPKGFSLWGIKPAQAAIALRNYLTCGEAKWDEVLA